MDRTNFTIRDAYMHDGAEHVTSVSAPLREQLAARVIPAMADANIARLARETGGSRTYLSDVRAGKIEASSDKLDKIARALGLTVTVDVTP